MWVAKAGAVTIEVTKARERHPGRGEREGGARGWSEKRGEEERWTL
ncbi:MAG TPA: hypothetical protein PKZ60_00255 [Candidatus Saccharicenans sp.]|nr:hypothetical protein [Candidatus Saccharicenans sp.]